MINKTGMIVQLEDYTNLNSKHFINFVTDKRKWNKMPVHEIHNV